MAVVKLSRLEFEIMEVFWERSNSSIREIQESFLQAPNKREAAYTTIQTTVYRMELKGAVERIRKVGNFHIFAAVITREDAQRTLIDDLLNLFGGRAQPIMARLIESGKLSMDDVKEAEKALKKLSRKTKDAKDAKDGKNGK